MSLLIKEVMECTLIIDSEASDHAVLWDRGGEWEVLP